MRMTRADAIAFCETLDKGHGQRYTLPSVQQLQDVLDYGELDPALTPGEFNNVRSAAYWSASLVAGNPTSGWSVSVTSGNLGTSGRSIELFVWCVRRDKGVHAGW